MPTRTGCLSPAPTGDDHYYVDDNDGRHYYVDDNDGHHENGDDDDLVKHWGWLGGKPSCPLLLWSD